jgi:NADH-quinone oxidoreductase subunit H
MEMNFFLLSLIKAGVVAFVLLTALAYLQLAERKLLAHIQLRIGPYRVGPHGFLQPLADVIKLVTKEDLVPPHVNRGLYVFAPFFAVTLSLIAIAVIPFGPEIEIFGVRTYMQLTDLNFGVLFIVAISSLGVYSVALGGWASNNKYALLGGLRSSAQMISYELPLAISVATPLILASTLSLRELVDNQAGYMLGFLPNWHVFQMPAPQLVGFVVFLIAAFAETNRLPFDLPEAENELVAGFHTEYSSMKFAAFFMAEYANILTITLFGATLFLGGWHPPFPVEYGSSYVPSLAFVFLGLLLLFHATQAPRGRDRLTFPAFAVLFLLVAAALLIPPVQTIIVPVFWLVAKAGILIFLFIWVRGTLPRFRYDQLMSFAWKFLFPVAVANLMATGLLVALWSR